MRVIQVHDGRVIAYPFSSISPKSKCAVRTLRGFTLIEVLIAMTLLSIMVVLLFSSLKICAQSWEQGESKITEVNEVAVVYNFFQRHLSSATPLWNDFNAKDGAATETEERTLSFQGNKQSLQFVSVFPASAGRSGMQLFSIEPQQQDKERLIKVTISPFFPLTEGEAWRSEEVVLLKHVSDFTLAYFGATDDGGESSWQDEWLGKDTQPRLVKINISTTNDVSWTEMIVELKVTNAISSDELGIDTPNGTEPGEVLE